MIAQVAFDLPLAEPFDYIIPPSLENRVHVGMRVEVLFGPKKRIGLVTGLLNSSSVDKLKSIRNVIDKTPLLDAAQMKLGQQISRYYGCSIGDALFTIVRAQTLSSPNVLIGDPEICKPGPPTKAPACRQAGSAGDNRVTLHVSPSGIYENIIVQLIAPLAEKKQKVLVLVPDQYVASSTEKILKQHFSNDDYVIGMRSSVFRSLADIGLVIMIDEDNSSFKQEQTPMYETRDVLLMRAKSECIDVAFISTTPTVEMMYLVNKGQIALKEYPASNLVKPQIVDLNTYKIMLRGILSPALLSPLESNVTKKSKSILVFNHRGSYAMTRCIDCGFILKCQRCDSPVTYSRLKKQYLCRYCSFHLPGDIACPTCKKVNWKSFGFGVEQLQKALQDKFPLARVHIFERGSDEVLKDFDILIGTSALLRFKNQIKAELVAFLDIDSELNRLDIHSCFRAWSMVGHLRGMAQKSLLIQSRQVDHYCVRSLFEDKREIFYLEDMKIRQELGCSPFAHQVGIFLRGKDQKIVEKIAQALYLELTQEIPKDIQVHAPSVEMVANKRGQYRLNILLQGAEVIDMITFVKEAMARIKRRSKVIITINVDP